MTRPPADETWSRRRTAFGSQAAAYAAGRPSYPDEAIRWVVAPGARLVLDLAAGTGKLSDRLLALGHDVVAVEPLAEMRAEIDDRAEVREGTAEQIPLDDTSVDAVVVGQAFHWFDVPHAMSEIRRVLRPGGTVGLFWNMLDDADPWVARLADLLSAEERASVIPVEEIPPYRDVAGMSPPRRRTFAHRERYDADRVEAYVLSRSQTILAGDAERDAQVTAVRALVPEGGIDLPLVCEAWRGERTS